MTKALIVYGTRYGATASTSEDIAETLSKEGLDVKVVNLKNNKVKDIAAMAVRRYKRLSLINYFKSPGETLKMAVSQPKIVLKFIQNLTAG